ncbi:hypothetical protein ACILDT_02435 [Capnocytophaga canis]|uniref:Secreted protein n=1 Tax=Capnocytophaga canis TaxID=1848903 RepID=A0A3A1YGK0_9FLAO|nr:hypothetical protein [Capnocytophaga canis]RIY36586.1 hypothetical protein CKY20_06510 [Capnocytophaga canis]
MKVHYLIISLFGFVFFANAQPFENKKRELPVVIPLEKAPTLELPSDTYTLPMGVETKENPFMKTPEKQIDFTRKSNLVHKKFTENRSYLNNYQQKEEYDAPKGNQFFGDFLSNGGYVNVYCRDFQAIDGDRVSILVNDKVEIHDILLVGDYKGFQIQLKPGFNKIEFLALNQGESGPNTADFKVLDDKGKIIAQNQWNLATGSKAQFVVVKEIEKEE